VIAYAKSKAAWRRSLLKRDDTSAYSNPDKDPRGDWKLDPVTAHNPYDADYLIEKPNGVKLSRPTDRYWVYSEETWKTKVAASAVVWGEGASYPLVKRYLADVQDGLVPVSLFKLKDYFDTTVLPRTGFGDTALSRGEIVDLFGDASAIEYTKPSKLVQKIVEPSTGADSDIVLDFFAGSGTTGQAVLNLNRDVGGTRRFVLVEVGEYFDAVLKPRVSKSVYSRTWRDGKPLDRTGVSCTVKYVRLESYEDALNNLAFRRTSAQQDLLDTEPEYREDYLLRYQLDVESQGSPSLLALDRFATPFDYRLKVGTGSVGETRAVAVDLVETFNYLLGLRVRTVDTIRGVRVVTGTSPEGERVLVLWRTVAELDADALNAWFERQGYSTRDREFDVVYVNGDHALENLRRPDSTWKVRLTEEEFHRRMFDVRDV